jgi:hypothetical protein
MSTVQENKAVIARWLDVAFNKPSEIDSLRHLISPSNKLDYAQLKLSWSFLHTQFRNIRANIVQQCAEGDKVFTMLQVEGENIGQEVAAGSRKSWEAFFCHTVRNGQVEGGSCGGSAGGVF